MKVIEVYINQGIQPGDTIIYQKSYRKKHNFLAKEWLSPFKYEHEPHLPTIIAYIRHTIVGPCNLPITQDLVAQLKPGDRILLKPSTCPEYDDLPRGQHINILMGFEHRIKKIYPNLNNKYNLSVGTRGMPILNKEIAKITFICKK